MVIARLILDQVWDYVSKDAKDLINRMLVSPEALRLTAAEASEHKWIQSHSADKEKPEVIMSVLNNLN
jgi:serine/threonine protein kinase